MTRPPTRQHVFVRPAHTEAIKARYGSIRNFHRVAGLSTSDIAPARLTAVMAGYPCKEEELKLVESLMDEFIDRPAALLKRLIDEVTEDGRRTGTLSDMEVLNLEKVLVI